MKMVRLPLSLNFPLNFEACVAAVGASVVLVDADILLSPDALWAESLLLGDADVLAGVSVAVT